MFTVDDEEWRLLFMTIVCDVAVLAEDWELVSQMKWSRAAEMQGAIQSCEKETGSF